MRYYIIMLLLLVLCNSCSNEKTDQILLEQDKKTLAENLNSDKITLYKGLKIILRSCAIKDTTTTEYQKHLKPLRAIAKEISEFDIKNLQDIPAKDAFWMYKSYLDAKSYIKETDEDIFPTITEGLQQLRAKQDESFPLLVNPKKAEQQNLEHAVLSMLVLSTAHTGQPLALYECAKTQPELLPDHELKTLLEFMRGFLFFSNKLYYLSEDGITRNIAWLEKNENIPLPYIKTFLGCENLSNSQTHIAFHAMNHLVRGFDRIMMDRKVDEERALDDFENFIADTKKLGFENEITLAIESYLYLKQENKQKAISTLSKLNQSNQLSKNEHELLQKTIKYLHQRETGKALNVLYDKFFISKVATNYIFRILAQVDWKKILKENNIAHADDMINMLYKMQVVSNSLNTYTHTKTLNIAKSELKQKGSELLNKVKTIFK